MRDEGEALETFVSSRRTALFRSAYLLCGNRDEADDLVQAALVKVVLGWRRMDGIDNVEAYARKTLVNTFIASRRRFWHREAPYAEPPVREAAGTDPDTGIELRSALRLKDVGTPRTRVSPPRRPVEARTTTATETVCEPEPSRG